MSSKVLLISGGTGVGTSSYSFELAKRLNIISIINTDYVREIIRSIINRSINPTLEKSTYTAGKTKNYMSKEENVKKSEIIRGYKNQSSALNSPIEAIIKRSTDENVPIIIEGVHLIPGKIRESEIYDKHQNSILEVLLYIEDSEVHKARFESREKEAPNRKTERYLESFNEIRWIHDYCLERARRFEDILLVNNMFDKEIGIQEIIKFYYNNPK